MKKQIEKPQEARPAHRPLKGSGPRQIVHVRVDPEAVRRIEIERKRKGQSLGDYLSEHGLALPAELSRPHATG